MTKKRNLKVLTITIFMGFAILLFAMYMCNLNVSISSDLTNFKVGDVINIRKLKANSSKEIKFVSIDSWDVKSLALCVGKKTFNKSMSQDLIFRIIEKYNKYDSVYERNRCDHFWDIYNKTAHLRSPYIKAHSHTDYDGPWIENIYIDEFKQHLSESHYQINHDHECDLRSIFGPFVPLFIQFTDLHVNKGRPACSHVMNVFKLFHSDYIYLIVIQDDDGIGAFIRKCQYNKQFINKWYNIWSKQLLIISAGGYGNVVIPLCKEDVSRYNHVIHNTRSLSSNKKLIGFAGDYHSGLKEMRKILIPSLQNNSQSRNEIALYRGSEWKEFVNECCYFILAPRGFGRASFSFCENIQMNNIPIYIYDDFPWLPYKILWNKFTYLFKFNHSFKTKINKKTAINIDIKINNLIYDLSKIASNQTEYNLMKIWISNNAKKLYTYKGIVNQIKLFMLNGPFNHSHMDNLDEIETVNNDRSYLNCVQQNVLSKFDKFVHWK